MAKKPIGIFIPIIHKTGRQDYLQKFSEYAKEAGYTTMCFNSYSDLYVGDNFDLGERSIFELALHADFSAMLIYSELIKDDSVNLMLAQRGKELGIPIFAVDKKIDGAFCISYSYGDSFEEIVDHVIEVHNAKNIYMMSGTPDNNFSQTREAAYKRSLEKHGIAFDKSKVYYGGFWELPTVGATKQLLKDCQGHLPDAIVCANDTMAISVCSLLEEQNINVPEDVIVTGFDGIDRSRTFSTTISTASPDYLTSAKYVMDTIKAIDNGEKIEPCDKVFGFRFCEGQSCGCEKITGRSAGLSNSQLYETLLHREQYTAVTDRMVLLNNDGRDIISVLETIKSNISEVLYAGIELYIDPRFFGDPKNQNCSKVLAARLAPDPTHTKNPDQYSVPFTPVPENHMCSDDIIQNNGSVILVPIHCQKKAYGYLATEFRYADPEGGTRLYDFVTHMNFLFSSLENTAKLNEVIEQLNALYVRDQLTDLLNRHGFYRELKRLAAKAEGSAENITFISADLDGLKYINDNFGHSEGDFAIVTIARILSEVAGSASVCARFGGDEYLAACITGSSPEQLKERFKEELAKINETANKPYPINASFGIEVAPIEKLKSNDGVEEVIRLADDKMFAQKRRSKFSRDMKRRRL